MSVREFFYLRHGQTDANHRHLLCGRGWDISLNQNGLAQAKEAANKIREAISALGTICTSPLVRARQTADEVAQHFSCPVEIVEELSEWDMGDWERKSYHEIKDIFHSEINPENGETRTEFNLRIKRALEISFSKSAPLLIVAHGEVWSAVRRVLEIPEYQMPNAVPHRVWQDNDKLWKVEALK